MPRDQIVFEPVGNQPEEALAYAVIMAQHENQWLYVRHKARMTWEIPGGHREAGETGLDAARRELREETGAVDFTITPVCVYGVVRDGKTTYGLLCKANVTRLGLLDPAMEIAEVMHHPALPDSLTYPDIQPALYWQVQGWLNTQYAPDELWDVYDENRRLTGHIRAAQLHAGVHAENRINSAGG